MAIILKTIFGHSEASDLHDETVKHLLPWQLRVWNNRDQRLLSIEASTGAGKSLAAEILAANWINESPKNKVVISVPQNQIGAEFEENRIALPDGSICVWEKNDNNYCLKPKGSKVESVKRFLEGRPPKDAKNRYLVCCNATLTEAFKRSNKNKVKNTLIIIDEAHHTMAGENGLGDLNSNRLGEVLIHTIETPSCRAALFTATHFRGDQNPIIPAKNRSDFTRIIVPFHEVMETCREWTKSLEINYDVYRVEPKESLDRCFNPEEKTVIFVEPRIAFQGVEYKNHCIMNTIKAIGDIQGFDEETGCYTVKSDNKTLIVADLANEDHQDKSQAFIKKCAKEKTWTVDVIVALKMFVEGCDYPPLAHCIIMGARKSIGPVIQMSGRVVRDWPTKPVAKITLVLPPTLNLTEESAHESLNNHVKFIISCMSMVAYFRPVVLREAKPREEREEGVERLPPPIAVVGGFNEQDELRHAAIRDMLMAVGHDDTLREPDNADARLAAMTGAVEGNLAPELVEHAPAIAQQLLGEMARTVLAVNPDIDLDTIDINYLTKSVDLGALFKYGSDKLTTRDFKNLVQLIEDRTIIPFDEVKLIVSKNRLDNNTKYCDFRESNPQCRLPSAPHLRYGYDTWSNFLHACLGTAYQNRNECAAMDLVMEIIRTNNLNTRKKYHDFRKSNTDLKIPSDPKDTYGIDIPELIKSCLGDGYFNRRIHMSHEDISRIIVANSLSSCSKYNSYSKQNPDLHMPTSPWVIYGYETWAEFVQPILGENYKNSQAGYDNDVVDGIVIENNLDSYSKYTKFKKEHPNCLLPAEPHKNCGLDKWSDYFAKVFGDDYIAHHTILSEVESARLIIENDLNTVGKYRRFRISNPNCMLPANPERAYNYESPGKFLENILGDKYLGRHELIQESEAAKIVVDNGLLTNMKYRDYRRCHPELRLPAEPWETYKRGTWDRFLASCYETCAKKHSA
jgi:hypothetical protein